MSEQLKSLIKASPYFGGLAGREILARNVREDILASDCSNKSELLLELAEWERSPLRLSSGGELWNPVLEWGFRYSA